MIVDVRYIILDRRCRTSGTSEEPFSRPLQSAQNASVDEGSSAPGGRQSAYVLGEVTVKRERGSVDT